MNSANPRNKVRQGLLLAVFALLLTACLREAPENPSRSRTQPATSTTIHPLARAVDEIERLDALRSSLARGLSQVDTITEATFNQVCRPVGQQARAIGKKYGWEVRQVAVQYRNPAHRPDSEARRIFVLFEQDSTLHNLTIRTHHDGMAGYRYFRRITVEPGCLACHGAKEARPAFIKERYPEDRAYGFRPGNLRGLYSVFIPLKSL